MRCKVTKYFSWSLLLKTDENQSTYWLLTEKYWGSFLLCFFFSSFSLSGTKINIEQAKTSQFDFTFFLVLQKDQAVVGMLVHDLQERTYEIRTPYCGSSTHHAKKVVYFMDFDDNNFVTSGTLDFFLFCNSSGQSEAVLNSSVNATSIDVGNTSSSYANATSGTNVSMETVAPQTSGKYGFLGN